VQTMNNSSNEKVLLTRKAIAQIIARWRREQNGSSLIEFALVLPVMLLVMTGIFSMGIAFNQQEQLTQAVGAGGQYLQQIRTSTTDPCKDTFTAITGAAPNLTSANITLTVTMGSTAVTAKTCAGDQTDLTQGGNVTVSATYPCSIIAYKYAFGTCTLNAEVTEYEY
jgi:Flp pilus assembly protein TadG